MAISAKSSPGSTVIRNAIDTATCLSWLQGKMGVEALKMFMDEGRWMKSRDSVEYYSSGLGSGCSHLSKSGNSSTATFSISVGFSGADAPSAGVFAVSFASMS